MIKIGQPHSRKFLCRQEPNGAVLIERSRSGRHRCIQTSVGEGRKYKAGDFAYPKPDPRRPYFFPSFPAASSSCDPLLIVKMVDWMSPTELAKDASKKFFRSQPHSSTNGAHDLQRHSTDSCTLSSACICRVFFVALSPIYADFDSHI